MDFFQGNQDPKNKTKCLMIYFKYLFSLENIKKKERNIEYQKHKPAVDQVYAVSFI